MGVALTYLTDLFTGECRLSRPTVRLRRHDLYRRTAYEALALRRRRQIHSRVADVILGAGDGVVPALLAVHLYEARRFDEAWRWTDPRTRRTVLPCISFAQSQ